MMIRTPAAPPPRRRRIALPILLGAAALGLSFGIGRWTAPDEARPAPVAEAPRAPEPAPAPFEPVAAAPVAAGQAAPAPAEAPAPAKPVTLTPAIANRVNEEAKHKLEAMREQVVATCLPSGGAGKASKRASVTYNLVFDAQGREIMRGISEDRRAPAGEFAKCLRQLKTPLTVSPPGTNVGLSIAVSYP